jgi:uncharacterized protein YuzE
MAQEKLALSLSVETDSASGGILAVYLNVREGKAAVTKEFKNGLAYADYDRKGRLLGIEMLGPCEIKVLDRIVRKESQRIKHFLHDHVPRGMAIAKV